MANELRISDETGLTYTCQVKEPASGGSVIDTVALSEDGSTGDYYGAFPAASAGYYDLKYIESGVQRRVETMYWNGSELLGDADFVTAVGFNTTTPPTAAAIRSEIDSNSTQLAAIIVDTGTDIPALIAALNDLSAAQVNAEVDTAIADASLSTHSASDVVDALTASTTSISLTSPLSADGAQLSVVIGATLEFTVTRSFPASWSSIEFVIKDTKSSYVSDDSAILKAVLYENDDDDGLIVLNKSAVDLPNDDAVITADQPNNTVTINVADDITYQLPKSSRLFYAIRYVYGSSESTVQDGQCRVDYSAAEGGNTDDE